MNSTIVLFCYITVNLKYNYYYYNYYTNWKMIKYKYNFDPLLQLCILEIIFWHLGVRSDIRRWMESEWTLSYENIMIIEHVGQEDRNITSSSSLQLTESSSRIIIIVSIASSRILQLIDIFWFKYGIIFFLAPHTPIIETHQKLIIQLWIVIISSRELAK